MPCWSLYLETTKASPMGHISLNYPWVCNKFLLWIIPAQQTKAVFLSCCAVCQRCSANAIEMGWATWEIWAVIKKLNWLHNNLYSQKSVFHFIPGCMLDIWIIPWGLTKDTLYLWTSTNAAHWAVATIENLFLIYEFFNCKTFPSSPLFWEMLFHFKWKWQNLQYFLAASKK